MRVRSLVVAAVLAGAVVLPPAPSSAAPHHRVVPCSRGLVALTFDDGPAPAVTPRMVRLLQRLDVPATFFMVGSRVATYPDVAGAVDRAGFAIGNHTWAHTDLTTQTPTQMRHALARTSRALADAGVHATDLARPPYGAVDDRVRRAITAAGLVTVLWTIDSRDWTGLSPQQIERRVVGAVRPHRTNVVLQHDGVTNSPATLKAIPGEVATLRRRGYCFAALDASGEPTPPRPLATIEADRRRIGEGVRVGLTVRLDRPTSRATTIRTTAGTVRIPVGRQVAHLTYRAPQDRTDEVTEDVTFKVYAGRGIQPALVTQALVRVVDDDPPPAVSIDDAAVAASSLLPVATRVVVRLDRERDRDLPLVVRSDLGPVRVVVPAFARHATGTVTVPVGRPRDAVQQIALHAAGAHATLTIRPPAQTRREAGLAAIAGVRWPTVRLSGLL